MIRTIVLRIGPSLVVTAGFRPGAPLQVHNLFRADQFPATPVIFK